MNRLNELIQVFCEIQNSVDMKNFFSEIFTAAEIKTFCDRWEIMKRLYQKTPQREIAGDLKISLCKITRGSKILKKKDSAFLKVLKKYYKS